MILDYWVDVINRHIHQAEESLRYLMKKIDNHCFIWDDFKSTAYALAVLTTSLRQPWRSGRVIDDRILELLAKKNSSQIMENFYLRMFYYDLTEICHYVEEFWKSINKQD